jgi:hypothetical protein
MSPAVAAERLAFLLNIWKVTHSNFGPETGCPVCGFNGSPQYLQQMAEYYLKLGHGLFLRRPFQFIIH